jgi:HTH-type transcriptional regulator / antitoxin HipB
MQTLIRSPKALGNLVRTARKTRGLSQTALGELVLLPQAAISFIENGHAALKLETLLVLLAALELDLQITPRAKGSIHEFADLL